MENKIEYFWETEYKFGEFLKQIFGNHYRRKYSLIGNGIFNLITIDNQIYEIKYNKALKFIPNDEHIYRDKNKEFITNEIIKHFKPNTEYSYGGGKYITFKIKNWIAKVEIIAKRAEPQ